MNVHSEKEKPMSTLRKKGKDMIISGERTKKNHQCRGGFRCLSFVFFLIAVAFFFPGVPSIMVTTDFPESTFVYGQKLYSSDPFSTLPCIQLRDDQTERPAMVRC